MKITAIAKKPVSGKIKTAPIGKTHAQIKGRGEHGFIDSQGKFEGRKAAAKIATKAHQVKHPTNGILQCIYIIDMMT